MNFGEKLWCHWQNLRGDGYTRGLHGRAWIHHRPRGQFEVEWHVPCTSLHVRLGAGSTKLGFSVSCYLFSCYLVLDDWTFPWHIDYKGREIELSFHHYGLWWSLWTPPHEWSSSTPKWRHGSFLFDDFLLGKNKYTCDYGETQQEILLMPEAAYIVEVRPMVQRWKRRRWPWPLVRCGFDLNIPDGIPIPGKGESAWDCDDSALMSTGSSKGTVEEALEDLRQHVEEIRERYGGKNWTPKKKDE